MKGARKSYKEHVTLEIDSQTKIEISMLRMTESLEYLDEKREHNEAEDEGRQ